MKAGVPVTITVLVALLVCLIPTTIGALLSAIGIAGMGRMMPKNVVAVSGRAVEAGDVDVLLLDKTGTIALGNRHATAFLHARGVAVKELADAAQLASLGGRLVAMTGDGTNDAAALAQADVAVAMHTGTQAAKEAGNMVDLDSNPTKLIEVVDTGKQMLMTRGALTTFSIANDVAKFFAIIPAAFVTTYPELRVLDVMYLATPESAILSAGDLQRAAHPLGAQGDPLPLRRRAGAVTQEPLDLRRGWIDRAVHRNQGDRPRPRRIGSHIRRRADVEAHQTGHRPLQPAHGLDRHYLSARRNWDRTMGVSRTSHRQLDPGRRPGARFGIDRPAVQ
jgi:hypothetical protein